LIKGSVIRKEAGYGGVRIDIQAKLDGARIALQVDIGFGYAVTPALQAIVYPVLLNDFPAPQLRVYPKHTVVAEKFHTVCLLGMSNTRMKDYFDLWVRLDDGTLDPVEIRRAIEVTFERRKMRHGKRCASRIFRRLHCGCNQANPMECVSAEEPAGSNCVGRCSCHIAKKVPSDWRHLEADQNVVFASFTHPTHHHENHPTRPKRLARYPHLPGHHDLW